MSYAQPSKKREMSSLLVGLLVQRYGDGGPVLRRVKAAPKLTADSSPLFYSRLEWSLFRRSMFLGATNARSVSAAQIALAKSVKTLLVLRARVSAIVRSSKLKVHEGEFFAVYFNTITQKLHS